MREISTDNYGPSAKALIEKAVAEARPKTLVFATPAADAETLLRAMTDQTISKNRRSRMPHDAQALHAALWLLFDFMTESHDISQALATPSGSYWHGILHRREPDAFNAKYWMARVGEHPIFPELLKDARELTAGAGIDAGLNLQDSKAWNAARFVDACCTEQPPEMQVVLLEIQRREWALLFDYNFSKAFA
jgi:hypothetical protein